MANTWKDAQCCSLLEKCKSKLQWDITLHWSERPSSKSLQTINAGEGVEKRDRSYTVGGNVNWYIKYNLNYIQWKLIQPLWKMVWRFLKKLGIKPPWKWKWSQLCPTLCDLMDCSLPGSTVHGIFQARILEWASISFSRGSSQPRDRTWVSCIADRHFTIWATREAPRNDERAKDLCDLVML